MIGLLFKDYNDVILNQINVIGIVCQLLFILKVKSKKRQCHLVNKSPLRLLNLKNGCVAVWILYGLHVSTLHDPS